MTSPQNPNQIPLTATFTVQGLKLKTRSDADLEGVICIVDWKLVATEDGLTAAMSGTSGLSAPDRGSFKPFNTVTEADVLSWLEGTQRFKHTKTMLQSILNQRKTEPVIVDAPLPWAQQ